MCNMDTTAGSITDHMKSSRYKFTDSAPVSTLKL